MASARLAMIFACVYLNRPLQELIKNRRIA